jgi:hypothetical protein
MFKNIILITTVLSQIAYATSPKSSEIQSWKEITVKKGYILSIDLEKEQQCSKIWTKQIKEFKKMNPKVKNPDIILVNQKIKVQSCVVQISEQSENPVKPSEIIKRQPNWFASVFAGVSQLGEKTDDTAKRGYSIGAKIGKNIPHKHNNLAISLGYLGNQSKTTDDNNKLGVYEITTHMITLQSAYLLSLSEKWSFGPELMAALGNDISMSDKNESSNLGLFAGLDLLYKVKKDTFIEFNIDQRMDDLSRTDVLANLGLKINF